MTTFNRLFALAVFLFYGIVCLTTAIMVGLRLRLESRNVFACNRTPIIYGSLIIHVVTTHS